MIFAISNGSCETKRATTENITTLRNCKEITTYEECGYFCATGWNGTTRVISVHFGSYEEREQAINPNYKPQFNWG